MAMAISMSMASSSSSARFLYSISSHRHIHHFLLLHRAPSPTLHLRSSPHYPSLSLFPISHRPTSFINPFSIFNPSTPQNPINRLFFGSQDKPFHWHFSSTQQNHGFLLNNGREAPEVAVVLLGWLGAKRKHLRRYAELYNAKGLHAVTFVASVMDVLSFDLGRRLEERVQKLAFELVKWLENQDSGGKERFLIFHTFSNTGWLAYGAILDRLKDRKDILERIKGCVVDSGGDPRIDPKVWAAGFATALLKKNSSATYASAEATEETQSGNGINGSKGTGKEPFLIESFLLFTFEKLFSFLLNLPDINMRLRNIIYALEKNQPSCRQLYLYSTGDKVIPFQAVESFIQEQRRAGKQVFSFNFGSSPHVDHYRTFPDVYASQLYRFLKECQVMVVKP